jgi:uncharacterized protein
MAEHPNAEVFRRAYAAFTTGDMAKLAEEFADDVVWHTAGNNPVSGDFVGRDAAFQSFGMLFERSGGTYRPELHDVLANDDHTVAVLHATGEREGKTLDRNYVIVFHISDGKIIEAWEADTDQAAWDDFWS